VSCAFRPIFGVHDHDRGAAGALVGVGFRDDEDHAGERAIGDEGFGAVEDVLIALREGAGADALQVGAGAGFSHRDGADDFAARQTG
jgi:hypothetical protein